MDANAAAAFAQLLDCNINEPRAAVYVLAAQDIIYLAAASPVDQGYDRPGKVVEWIEHQIQSIQAPFAIVCLRSSNVCALAAWVPRKSDQFFAAFVVDHLSSAVIQSATMGGSPPVERVFSQSEQLLDFVHKFLSRSESLGENEARYESVWGGAAGNGASIKADLKLSSETQARVAAFLRDNRAPRALELSLDDCSGTVLAGPASIVAASIDGLTEFFDQSGPRYYLVAETKKTLLQQQLIFVLHVPGKREFPARVFYPLCKSAVKKLLVTTIPNCNIALSLDLRSGESLGGILKFQASAPPHLEHSSTAPPLRSRPREGSVVRGTVRSGFTFGES